MLVDGYLGYIDGPQDDLLELGGPAAGAPYSPREAVRRARDLVKDETYVGEGYCLRTIRGPVYGVGALYPDAETAWEEAKQKHRTSDPDSIPFGVPVWWVNGGHGHVAISLGDGRCLSTDYARTGYLGPARISALADWCGGRLAGWSEDINGVDVWDRRVKPWTLEDRLELVQAALRRAIERNASERRIEGLRDWRDDLRDRVNR